MALSLPFEIHIIIIPLFLIPLIFFILYFKKSHKTPPLPPGPIPWPIIGNILQMGKNPHITLSDFAKTYGPLMSLKLGTKYLVVGSSPVVAIEILKTHDRILSGRHVPYALPSKRSELDTTSIGWNPECNDGWRYLRTLCRTELFSSNILESQASLKEKKVMELVKFLKSKEGNVVNIGEVVFATVLNMLSNVLISKDVIKLEEEKIDGGMKTLIRGMIEVASAPNVSDFYPILSKLDLQGLSKKSLEMWPRICSMWEPILEERRNKKQSGFSSQNDFLNTLLDNGFTNTGIHQLFMELFFAGTDTMTSTIEWAMAELIKNEDTMNKVCQELETAFNGGDLPIESHLLQLSYLQACMKETLRLHPPAPLLLPHRAIETCQVMSYTIPQHAQVLVNVWAIGRDPLIWDEPLRFKPDRFLMRRAKDFKGNDFEFLPFGAGRRICPGLALATKSIALVLASLVHLFDWELPYGKHKYELDMSEKFGVTLQKKEPLLLVPKARKFTTGIHN